MEDIEFVQRVEYLVCDKSHLNGDLAFQVYHGETDSLVLSVKQCADYLDNSKIMYDSNGKKLLKMRRDQGRSVMPMYIHDYRTKTEYRWKSRDVLPYIKSNSKNKSKEKERHLPLQEPYERHDLSYTENKTEDPTTASTENDGNDNDNSGQEKRHEMTIATSVDKLTFEIMDRNSNETLAFVRVHDKLEAGVCSYKVSANSDADIPFIMTLVISVDERYMRMARLKGTAISTYSCTIQ